MKFAFNITLLICIIVLTFGSKLEAVEKKLNNYPKINGVQVFVLDSKYKGSIDTFFKEAKAKGVNTVFFRVFHNQSDRPHLGLPLECSNGVYFKTTETCTVYDLLPEIIMGARNSGIKIFAWMASRSLTYLKTDDKISLSFAPDGSKAKGYGANIFREDVSLSIVKIFTDLAKYDIDGILLQDDFIIKYNEGADEESIKQFNNETGFTSSPQSFFSGIKEINGKKVFSGYKDIFYIWSLWKHTHLMYLFKRINNAVKSANPKVLIAANVYYETPLDVDMALAWYAQSIKGLMNAGTDYFAIMGYAEQISTEKKLDKVTTMGYVGEIVKNSMQQIKNYDRIIIKLQNSPFVKMNDFINHIYSAELCESVKKTGVFNIIQVPVNNAEDIVSECL